MSIAPVFRHPYTIYGPGWYDVLRAADVETSLPAPRCRNGELEEIECVLMAFTVRRLQPTRIFEFGTFLGTTTLILSSNAPADAEVFTLDISEKPDRMSEADCLFCNSETVGAAFRGEGDDKNTKIAAAKITQLWGDSLTYDFSPYYRSMDLVFVDGGHEYEVVLSDLRNASKMLRDPYYGVIFVHDFALWRPSVLWATAEYVNDENLELYVFQSSALAGIGTGLRYLFAVR